MKKTYTKILGVAITLVLLASLIVGALPVGAVSTPSVSLSTRVLSTLANYTINFQTSQFGFIATPGGTITVRFPAGYVLPTTITALLNINFGPLQTATVAAAVTVNPTTREVVISPTAANATNQANSLSAVGNVQLILYGVRNPDTPGDRQIEVKTSGDGDTAYVASNIFSIVTAELPTLVTVYNSAGFFIGAAQTFGGLPGGLINNGVMIELDPGTYNEALTFAANSISVAPSTGDNSNTILQGFTFNGTGVTLNNLRLMGTTILNGNNATVSNCVIRGEVDANGTNAMFTGNTINNTVVFANTGFTLTNSTIDITGTGTPGQAIILDNAATLAGAITNSTFNINTGDTAITISDTVAGVSINNNEFNGARGTGVAISAAAQVIVANNEFGGVQTAVNVSNGGADVDILNNDISDSAVGTTPSGAIEISNGPTVNVLGNLIFDSAGYSVNVSGGTTANITATGNNMRLNALGFNNGGTGTLLAVQNWWGSPTGPFNAATNPAGQGDPVSANVTYRPFVGAPPSASGSALTANSPAPQIFDFTGTTGVLISGYSTTIPNQVIVSQKLSSNPTALQPPLPASAFFDVYTQVASTTGFQIKFYGNVAANTRVMYYSSLSNSWVLCTDQGVSGLTDFAFVNIGAAGTGIHPTVDELTGTYFALVTGFSPQPTPFNLTAPVGGEQPLSNITFVWPTFPDATSYRIQVANNAAFSTPLVVNQASLTLPVYQYTGADLADGTTYYWQATAYQGTQIIGQSNIGYFTAAAPDVPPSTVTTTTTTTTTPTTTTSTVITTTATTVTTIPTTITIITQPPATITFTTTNLPAPQITITNPPAITIAQPDINQITPAWIYVIIGIGAVLIIVIIVLIVRTRRTV